MDQSSTNELDDIFRQDSESTSKFHLFDHRERDMIRGLKDNTETIAGALAQKLLTDSKSLGKIRSTLWFDQSKSLFMILVWSELIF